MSDAGPNTSAGFSARLNRYAGVICFILLLSLLFPAFLYGQDSIRIQTEKARDVLQSRGEVIVKFVRPSGYGTSALSTMMSISAVKKDTITAYMSSNQFEKFLSLKVPFTVIEAPSLKVRPGTFLYEKSTPPLIYPSYSQYISMMEGFASAYPDICRLDDFGRSVQGRKLLALKISDDPSQKEDEPVLFFTSTMHGDELTGYVLMLRLIGELLDNYATRERVRNLVDNAEIWINPLSNPDGTYFESDESVYGARRFNANNVDLNRNFPDPDMGDHPDGNEWQPENVAMMNFGDSIGFNIAANFHTGIELVNYPWDTWPKLHPDNDWYYGISRAYADTAHLHSPEGYMTDEDMGITKGYDWYEINGGRQDFSNYFYHAREVTIELSTDIPDESELGSYWEYNKRSLFNYMELLFTGVKGSVTDSKTGNPLNARVMIKDRDDDYSAVYSNDFGSYYRFLLPGTYELEFSCPGYRETELTVNVIGNTQVTLNAELDPLEGAVIYPDPFSDVLNIYIGGTEPEIHVDFFDMSGRLALSFSQPFTGEGIQVINASELAKGSYILNIRHDGNVIRKLVVKGY